MSSAAQILFNSPALNSLKREQLIKLCKRHGLKANGKNSELIERLKLRATELPTEGVEWREDEDEEYADDDVILPPSPFQPHPARPSEQWEVVMENIEEEDEPSSRTNTITSMRSVRTVDTAGEFGTSNSKGGHRCPVRSQINDRFSVRFGDFVAESRDRKLLRVETRSDGQRGS